MASVWRELRRREVFKVGIRIYEPLFDALRDLDLIEKLASGNFLRVMRHSGVALDPSYQYPENKYTQQPRTFP